MASTSKYLLALIAGAAAGVAIGVLISSEKGSDIRKKAGDQAKKLTDTILQKAEEVIDNLGKNDSKA